MLMSVFKSILMLSVAGGIVALAILILRAIFWRRLPARLQYALWALLIVRLVMPVAPSSPLSLFGLNAQKQAAAQSVSTITSASNPAAVLNTTSVNNTETTGHTKAPAATVQTKPQAVSPASTAATKAASAFDFGFNYKTAAFIWIMGSAALLFYFFAVNLAMRIIFSRRKHCEDRTVTAALDDCRARLKLRMPVGVVYDDCAKSPGVFGVIRPKVIISKSVAGQLDSTELRYIFMHELTHIKRLDNIVNLVIMLLEAVNWFNPVLWFAFCKMKEDCEISCDASVLAALGEDERRAYGDTIVTVLQSMPRTAIIPGAAGFTSSFSRRRIVMIANKNKSVPIVTVALVLAGTLLAGCASLPAKAHKTASSGISAATTSFLRTSSVGSSVNTVKLNLSKAEIIYYYHKYYDLDKGQKAELTVHGYTTAQISKLDVYDFNKIELKFKLSAKEIKSEKESNPKLKNIDISSWTYGDLDAYYEKQDAVTYAPTAKQAKLLKKRGVSLKLARQMLKEYCTYATMLAQPDGKLKKMMKLYEQTNAEWQVEEKRRTAIRTQYLENHSAKSVSKSTLAGSNETLSSMAAKSGYDVIKGSMTGGYILSLPVNAKSPYTDINHWKFLSRRNSLSKKNGLDFSTYFGKKVTLYFCDGKKRGSGENTELLGLFNKDKLVGFWAMPKLKDVGLADISYQYNRDSSVLRWMWCSSTQGHPKALAWDDIGSFLVPWDEFGGAKEKLYSTAGYRIECNGEMINECTLPVSFNSVIKGYKVGAYLKSCNQVSKKYGYDFSAYLGKKIKIDILPSENVYTHKSSDMFCIYYGKKFVGFWLGSENSWQILDHDKFGFASKK